MSTTAVLRPEEPARRRLRTHARRIVTTRTRAHASDGPRPLVKSTAGVHIAARPHLHLVPRRSRAARAVALIAVLLCALMLGTAAFQTQLPPRQMELDQLDRQIRAARVHYDELRRERAQLLSPSRLASQAPRLGMVPVNRSEFVAIDPDVIATVQMSSGGVFDNPSAPQDAGLSTNEAVKSVGGFGK